MWAAAVQIFPLKFLLVAILVGFFLGVWAAQKTGEDLGVEDAGCIVIDEVVAVWFVCLWFPQNWVTWTAAFLAFRLFDIVKLPPASRHRREDEKRLGRHAGRYARRVVGIGAVVGVGRGNGVGRYSFLGSFLMESVDRIAQELGKTCSALGIKIVTAESCTGGLIAGR